MMMIHTWEYDA